MRGYSVFLDSQQVVTTAQWTWFIPCDHTWVSSFVFQGSPFCMPIAAECCLPNTRVSLWQFSRTMTKGEEISQEVMSFLHFISTLGSSPREQTSQAEQEAQGVRVPTSREGAHKQPQRSTPRHCSSSNLGHSPGLNSINNVSKINTFQTNLSSDSDIYSTPLWPNWKSPPAFSTVQRSSMCQWQCACKASSNCFQSVLWSHPHTTGVCLPLYLWGVSPIN